MGKNATGFSTEAGGPGANDTNAPFEKERAGMVRDPREHLDSSPTSGLARMHTPSFGIIIVTHNNEKDLDPCLDSLLDPGKASDVEVIVRDCNSTDDSVRIAQAHPVVTKVISGANVGFGAAVNDAVASLDHPVDNLLILNPDSAIGFALTDLRSRLRQYPRLGCASVRQLALNDHRIVWSWDRFPNPRLEWQKASNRPLLQRSPAGYTRDRTVDWVMGALLAVPFHAFSAVGGFDEDFFMFNDEVDLCKRIAATGLDIVYMDSLCYFHDRCDKATIWREVLRLNSRRTYDRKWLSLTATLRCQAAQTYRWFRHLYRPDRRHDRRLVVPRVLATWGLLEAVTPPDPAWATMDSWRTVRPALPFNLRIRRLAKLPPPWSKYG
jgi:N-acetylglucosaminyl-diphospho-decaprenol L-rhamnosyltransferase